MKLNILLRQTKEGQPNSSRIAEAKISLKEEALYPVGVGLVSFRPQVSTEAVVLFPNFILKVDDGEQKRIKTFSFNGSDKLPRETILKSGDSLVVEHLSEEKGLIKTSYLFAVER